MQHFSLGCRSLENEIPVSGPGDAREPLLHVTYWMFFPYNEGKPVCVLDLGPLGPWPLPLLWGSCLGTYRRFGAHVGDWEHVSLFFSVRSCRVYQVISLSDTHSRPR